MNPLRYSVSVLVVLCIAFCVGCASRPDEALKLAQQAMEEARQLEAADFARADWDSAQKAWDDAQKALQGQHYAQAAGLLATARSRFEKSATIAKAQRYTFRKELALMQSAANKRVSALREEVAASRASAKGKQSLNNALTEIEAAVEKVNTEVLNERLIQAKTSAKVALEKLDELAMEVSALGKRPAR